MSVTRIARGRMPAAVGIGAVLAAILCGCVPADAPSPSSSPSSIATAPGVIVNPTAPPDAAPTLDLGGTAVQNLAYFNLVMRPLLSKYPNTPAAAIIATLVKAGFPRKAIEITADKTTIGLDADNKAFSVRLGGTCIVGQTGNTGYNALAMPILSTGNCLIGSSR